MYSNQLDSWSPLALPRLKSCRRGSYSSVGSFRFLSAQDLEDELADPGAYKEKL
jgi:hypothetical protein